MEDGPILLYHDVGVVPVLDVQQVLDQAEPGVGLGEPVHDRLMGSLFAQCMEVADKPVLLLLLDLVDGGGVFHKLVECAPPFRDDFVGDDVLLPQYGVEVLDVLHGDDLVGQLVVVLVEEVGELKVQHQRAPVLGLDEETVLYVYVHQFPQGQPETKNETF